MQILVVNDVEIVLPPTVDELITDDGQPLESEWHRAQINLLVDSLSHHWLPRTDLYAGGNMFVYYSMSQVRNRHYRGPDFFVALDVDGAYHRKAWLVWEEDGQYPDVIVELLSPTTAKADLTTKKELYERVFHTTDYYCYEPDEQTFLGWTLDADRHYQPLTPNERGWLWCRRLGLWLGTWEGKYLEKNAVWLRFFAEDGTMALTKAEDEERRAEAAALQSQLERERAETAVQQVAEMQAENDRLRARLLALGIDPEIDV